MHFSTVLLNISLIVLTLTTASPTPLALKTYTTSDVVSLKTALATQDNTTYPDDTIASIAFFAPSSSASAPACNGEPQLLLAKEMVCYGPMEHDLMIGNVVGTAPNCAGEFALFATLFSRCYCVLWAICGVGAEKRANLNDSLPP